MTRAVPDSLALAGSIPPNRRLRLNSRLAEKRADQLVSDLDRLGKTSRWPVCLSIRSKGGNYLSAMKVCDGIMNSQAPVYGYVSGYAYSGAAIILQACTRRVARPQSKFLFHYNSQTFPFVVTPFMDTDALKLFLDGTVIPGLERRWKQAHDLLLSRVQKAGKSEDELHALLRSNRIINAEEALQWGLIDEILTI